LWSSREARASAPRGSADSVRIDPEALRRWKMRADAFQKSAFFERRHEESCGMDHEHNVVILGGGLGGLSAANRCVGAVRDR